MSTQTSVGPAELLQKIYSNDINMVAGPPASAQAAFHRWLVVEAGARYGSTLAVAWPTTTSLPS